MSLSERFAALGLVAVVGLAFAWIRAESVHPASTRSAEPMSAPIASVGSGNTERESAPPTSGIAPDSDAGMSYEELIGLEFDGRPALLADSPVAVTTPAVASAREATLSGDSEVIGVLVGGVARAYDITAMSDVESHVVNDVVNGRPITVTYCDLSDCVRVLTDDGDGPLELQVTGVVDDESGPEMLIVSRDRKYRQQDPTLPFSDHTFERMSWADWVAAHPETGAYQGVPVASPGS